MRIDAHQHFWEYSPVDHSWMTESMAAIKRDFLPPHLEPLLASSGFDGSIAVQARQSPEETNWLLDLAERFAFIRGVVGWMDLCSAKLPSQLKEFRNFSKLVGVRHVVQDEVDDHFMLRPEFLRGVARLQEFGLTYDLLLFPRHLPVAARLVEQFPGQAFVLDHIAKPNIAGGAITPWREDLQRLAQFPNVCCKLSGMVTEARWKQWQPDDLRPFLEVVIDAFGADRLMIGSDWPVCTLSADYDSTMRVVLDYFKPYPHHAQTGVFGENCARFYGIQSRSIDASQ